jgi:hypothetical protein
MAKSELQIGKRAYQEAMRLCENAKTANEMLGCNSKGHVYKWNEGIAPSAKYLQRLHYMGADVIYILIGVRKIEVS